MNGLKEKSGGILCECIGHLESVSNDDNNQLYCRNPIGFGQSNS
jgi:hypothetical protein